MKLSLKLEDQNRPQTPTDNPIVFRAKIPITVFGLPFLSAFSATHHHSTSDNLSLSLRTHFNSGPSLKLSYNTPTTTSPATATAAAAPLTLTLKSGVSLFGSPNNSPLIISANFSFSPHNPNPNPTFTLQFKPRLGSFSLRKSVSSNPNPNKKLSAGSTDNNNNENSFGFVPLDKPINWKELTVDSATKDSILSGILVMADTELPVTKRFSVNLRWGVGVPPDYGKQLPFLRVNKIKIQRIDEEKEDKGVKGKENEIGYMGEFEMLKGMNSWMTRQLCDLQRENREMKQMLEEMKLGQPVRSNHGYRGGGGVVGGGGRRMAPVAENSGGFEQWRNKKSSGSGDEESGQRETKSNSSSMSDVESELQKAIKAASSQ